MSRLSRNLVAFAALLMMSGAQAAEIRLNADDSGWYDASSGHNPFRENYVVGRCATCTNTQDIRNFFVFDLSGVTDTITSASLALRMPATGYVSADPTETYEVFSYESSVASLLAGSGSFSDLGDGTSYGSLVIANTDIGTNLKITLNASAINALNLASGQFAFGGVLASLSVGGVVDEFVFGDTHIGNPTRQLLLNEEVPIPAAVWLLGSALGILGWMRRRQLA